MNRSRRSVLKLLLLGMQSSALAQFAGSSASAATGVLAAKALRAPPSSALRVASSSDFVQVQSGRLTLNGQDFAIRGTNYFGSWRLPGITPGPDGTEFASAWAFYKNFNPADTALDFQFLRAGLNATVVRIGTPSEVNFVDLVRQNSYRPWFNTDGTITDYYKKMLIQLADLAHQNGIRIQFCLLWKVGWEIRQDRDAFKPGASKDQFYSRQVRSIAQALRDHPGVLGYSIGNEVLIAREINFNHPSWYEPRAGGFILRRMRDVRAVAPQQLLTTDEPASPGPYSAGRWFAPGADFALLPDVDGSNGGRPFRLVDQVDYIGSHFYPVALSDKDTPQTFKARLETRVRDFGILMQAARQAGKPLAIGEFGLRLDPPTISQEQYSSARDLLFERVLAEGQRLGLQGLLAWLALPQTTLRPGHYAMAPSTLNRFSPAEVDVDRSDGQRERILFLEPQYNLFTWGPTGDAPQPTAAARALAGAWPTVTASSRKQ